MSSNVQILQRQRPSERRSSGDRSRMRSDKGQSDCNNEDCAPTLPPPAQPPSSPEPVSTTSESTIPVAQTTASASFVATSTIISISSTIDTTTATTSEISSSTSTSTIFSISLTPSSSQSTFSSSIDQSSLQSISTISTTAQPDTASSSSSVAILSLTSSPSATASDITSVQMGKKNKILDPIAIILVIIISIVILGTVFFLRFRHQRRKRSDIHEAPSGSPPPSPSQPPPRKGVAESRVVPVTADYISTVTMSTPFTSNPYIPKGDTKQAATKNTRFSIPKNPFVDPVHHENVDVGNGFTVQRSSPKTTKQSPRVIRPNLYALPKASKTNTKPDDDEKRPGWVDEMVFEIVQKDKDGRIVEVGKRERV